MRKFFVSVACVPTDLCDEKEQEVVDCLRIRVRKGTFWTVPTHEFEFDNKEEFKNKMLEVAEEMWVRKDYGKI